MTESGRGAVAGGNRRSLPLQIDLDPAPVWGFSFQQEFGLKRWRAIWSETAGRADGYCEVCGDPFLAGSYCNAKWSWRLVAGDDGRHEQPILVRRLTRFEALCIDCYFAKHFGQAELRGFGGAARARLATVNKITPNEVEAMIGDAAELWRWRSTFVCVTELGTWGQGATR